MGRTLIAVVLGAGSAVKRAEMVAKLLDHGFRTTGGQTVTLGTLGNCGTPDAPPADLRGEICDRKPASAQSEDAGADFKGPRIWLRRGAGSVWELQPLPNVR